MVLYFQPQMLGARQYLPLVQPSFMSRYPAVRRAALAAWVQIGKETAVEAVVQAVLERFEYLLRCLANAGDEAELVKLKSALQEWDLPWNKPGCWKKLNALS